MIKQEYPVELFESLSHSFDDNANGEYCTLFQNKICLTGAGYKELRLMLEQAYDIGYKDGRLRRSFTHRK